MRRDHHRDINPSIKRTHGSILSNLRLGGIIAEIDGKPTEEFFQENREYRSDSNEHSERADLFPKLI